MGYFVTGENVMLKDSSELILKEMIGREDQKIEVKYDNPKALDGSI